MSQRAIIDKPMAKQLREQGNTYVQIGKYFGVSSTAAFWALNPDRTAKRKLRLSYPMLKLRESQ